MTEFVTARLTFWRLSTLLRRPGTTNHPLSTQMHAHAAVARVTKAADRAKKGNLSEDVTGGGEKGAGGGGRCGGGGRGIGREGGVGVGEEGTQDF